MIVDLQKAYNNIPSINKNLKTMYRKSNAVFKMDVLVQMYFEVIMKQK